MKEIHRLKKIAQKYNGKDSLDARRHMRKISTTLRLDNRPWLVSLIVVLIILFVGIGISLFFKVPPTTLSPSLGYVDGTTCYKDADCQSSFCTLDVDGSRYCSQAGTCVRKESGIVNVYPSTGTFSSNTVDPDGVGYKCDMGFWSEDPFATTHTFSQITFSEKGSDSSTAILVPVNTQVRDATLYVYSIPSYQVILEEDFERAKAMQGYSVYAKEIAGESKIVVTDLSGNALGTYQYQEGTDWTGYDFSVTTANVDGETKLILAARSQDTFAIYTIGKHYVTNPKVDVGENGLDWEYSGKLTSSSGPQKIDFTQDLADILNACIPVGGICNIPIVVYSDTPGAIILSNLNVLLNSPPRITSLSLDPPFASYGEPITCIPIARDIDSDPISYKYRWYRNGVLTSVSSNILPPEKVQKGDLWKCLVTPLDSYSEGAEVASREIHVSGLSDYTPCASSNQCESNLCVSGICCSSDPCPGDNICSPGEDGTYDDECCITGDGLCTGGCPPQLDNDCTNPWSKTELEKRKAKIVVHSLRNDKTLLLQVVDKDGKPLSRAPIEAKVADDTINIYTNSDGYASVDVEWGERVVATLEISGIEYASKDVVIEKKAEVADYKDEDLQKLGFVDNSDINEVEWKRTELQTSKLTITFPEKKIEAGAPIEVRVTDINGDPIAGVPITLETTEGEVTAMTNNLGLVSIQEYAGDPLGVKIEKDGYVIASEEVTLISTRISYWAMVPILVLIIPLIVFFVFSTARGRIPGFGVKPTHLAEPKPKASEIPRGMNTSEYTKKLHALRQSPTTAQVLKHVASSITLLSERDYSGAQQEIDISKKLLSGIKAGLTSDGNRILSSKLASAEKEVNAAYSKKLETLKHAPAAQKMLDHMKFLEGRVKEVKKIETEIRKSVKSQMSAILTSSFVKRHPENAENILEETEELLQTEIFDGVDDLVAHLNNLRNNLLEAHSEKVLTMEGMSDAEVNRKIASTKKEIESKVEHIVGHLKYRVETIV